MDLEVKNKEWLVILKAWTSCSKNDEPVSNGNDVFGVLQEFSDKRETLVQHLKDLIEWLSKNDIKEALMRLPSVGKLLTYLCRIPAVLTTDEMSTLVVDCMLRLSNMLVVNGRDEDSASQRAKHWAIKNLNGMTNVAVDGIDKFLMDEFGVSQHEYMTHHLETAVRDILDASQCRNHQSSHQSHFRVNSCSLLKELSMIQNEVSLEIIDQIIAANDLNDVLCSEEFVKLVENSIDALSIESVRVLFVSNFCLYERYIVKLIMQALEEYPKIDRAVIERLLHEYRFLELLVLDERLLLGFHAIVRESFKVLGTNPVLCVLTSVVNEAVDCSCAYGDENTTTVSEVLKELKIIHNGASGISDEENVVFDLWFQQVKSDVINKIFPRLFSESSEDMRISIELLVWFFQPHHTSDLASTKLLLTHLKMLKRLLPKKFLELNDLQLLVLDLRRSLDNSLSPISIVVHVVFSAHCVGVKSFIKDLLSLLVLEDIQGSIFWFLYAIDILKKIVAPCQADVLRECKNQVKILQEMETLMT